MSFAKVGRGPATTEETVAGDVQQLAELVHAFEGGPTPQMRARCETQLANVVRSVKETVPESESGRYRLRRLETSVGALRERIQAVVVPVADETTALVGQESPQEDSGYVQMQTQLAAPQVQGVEYHAELVEDRAEAIAHAQRGVEDINHIFHTLDRIVVQQGEQVRSIEDNIGSYAQETRGAMGELTRADAYQRRKGRWCLMILIVLSLILLIMVIAVV